MHSLFDRKEMFVSISLQNLDVPIRFFRICRGVSDILHFLIYIDIVMYDLIFQKLQGYNWCSRQLLRYLPY